MSKVSVIIPLHNKADWIGETLASLLAQTHSDWEAIVVENNSSDDGASIVRRISDSDSRVRLVLAPTEVAGPGAARNHGLTQAEGDWILFLDADDLLSNNHLESLSKTIATSGSAIAVSDWLEFHSSIPSPSLSLELPSDSPTSETIAIKHAIGSPSSHTNQQPLLDYSIASAPWAIHCALIERSVFNAKETWWSPKLDSLPSEDTAFWFRIVHSGDTAYSGLPSALYRVETANSRNDFEDLQLWFNALTAVHQSNIDFLRNQEASPTPSQCESLMRVWSDLGNRANRENFGTISKEAYKNAAAWNRKTRPNSLPLLLRRLLGCQLFDSLMNHLR